LISCGVTLYDAGAFAHDTPAHIDTQAAAATITDLFNRIVAPPITLVFIAPMLHHNPACFQQATMNY
jgi:hypothetical protein